MKRYKVFTALITLPLLFACQSTENPVNSSESTEIIESVESQNDNQGKAVIKDEYTDLSEKEIAVLKSWVDLANAPDSGLPFNADYLFHENTVFLTFTPDDKIVNFDRVIQSAKQDPFGETADQWNGFVDVFVGLSENIAEQMDHDTAILVYQDENLDTVMISTYRGVVLTDVVNGIE